MGDLSRTDDPHRFLLRVTLSGGGEHSTSRSDVVAEMVFSNEHGFRWRYLAHENYERPALGTQWSRTAQYTMERISRKLRQRIKVEVMDALCDHFLMADPEDDDYMPDINRRELLMMLVTFRMSRMYRHDPRESLTVAVDYLARICGGERALARMSFVSLSSLSRATRAKQGLSAQSLNQLADAADRKMEWFLADYLRSQARTWDRRYRGMLDGVEWSRT